MTDADLARAQLREMIRWAPVIVPGFWIAMGFLMGVTP